MERFEFVIEVYWFYDVLYVGWIMEIDVVFCYNIGFCF